MQATDSTVHLTVNGTEHQVVVPARLSLADLLRERLGLTGTRLGCEHGVCGACTVLLDGQPVRACIMLAAACQDRTVTTVEGLEGATIAELRTAFSESHALQCGFCTSGMLVTAMDVLARRPELDEETARLELAGNICRCTGYQGIVEALVTTSRRTRNADASHR